MENPRPPAINDSPNSDQGKSNSGGYFELKIEQHAMHTFITRYPGTLFAEKGIH